MSSTSTSTTATSSTASIPTINYNPATQQWHSLGLSATELRPDVTLINGQTFTWQPVKVTSSKNNVTSDVPINEWSGVLDEHVLHIRQLPDDTEYTIIHSHNSQQKDEHHLQQHVHQQLLDYLWIQPFPRATTNTATPPLPSLASLYPQWSQADQRFQTIAQHLPGVRLLRQNPLECLYSFICSSNNHIQRITKMLDSLRTQYGTKICTVQYPQQDEERSVTFAMFPRLQQLKAATEQHLREMGFGYRAKFIVKTTQQLLDLGGEQWLHSLRTMDRKEVESLLEASLHGVGRKVASCVALFSCDQLSAVPIDTHMYQLVQKHYGMKSKSTSANKDNKAINAKLYEEIGEIFRDRFGTYAGWAHSVLFTAELRLFAEKLGSASKHHKSTRKQQASEVSADKAESTLSRAASQPIFQKVEALADEILPMLSDSSKENDEMHTNGTAVKPKRRASMVKHETTSDFDGMVTPPRKVKKRT